MERCCGVCRRGNDHLYHSNKIVCEFPLPSWLTNALFWKLDGGAYLQEMDRTDGTDCPCFERKEA